MGYGTFRTPQGGASLGLGTDKLGIFTAVNASRSDCFLDTPEEAPHHADGHNVNVFTRLDYRPGAADTLHLNGMYARSGFHIPNDYTQQTAGQDQQQKVESFNIAPGWAHVLNTATLLTVNPWYRHDRIDYSPSASPLADQPATMAQVRTLTNFGAKADLAYATKRHSLRAGVQASRTNLMENFTLGLTDPTFNPVCLTASGDLVTDPSITDPAACCARVTSRIPIWPPGFCPTT